MCTMFVSAVQRSLDSRFADRVAKACIARFQSLGKTGKPRPGVEWTVLAGVVQEGPDGVLEVVALGSGTRCVGSEEVQPGGGTLHDSHAEVLARRSFVLYLLDQIHLTAGGQESIFGRDGDKFQLKPGFVFHFYASNTPCGDASIFPKQDWLESCGEIPEVVSGARLAERDPTEDVLEELHLRKKMKVDDTHARVTSNSYHINVGEATADTHRTGAKCVSGEEADPKLPGIDYHKTGVLRTKPGRGDPSLAHCCSDKMARWTVLGLQGALLTLLLRAPIYVASVTIGRCPYSQAAMERALRGRFEAKLTMLPLPVGYQVTTPVIQQSDVEFPFSRRKVIETAGGVESKVSPTPTSIIWSKSTLHGEKQEAATNGYKLGTAKKNIGSRKSWTSICRRALGERVAWLLQDLGHPQAQVWRGLTYGELKGQAYGYMQAWHNLRTEVLTNWTIKPHHMQSFKLEEN